MEHALRHDADISNVKARLCVSRGSFRERTPRRQPGQNAFIPTNVVTSQSAVRGVGEALNLGLINSGGIVVPILTVFDDNCCLGRCLDL